MTSAHAPAPRKPLVLLVDDVEENLRLLAGLLADEYELAFAASGEQALAMTQELAPALILLDVMMPGMDGLEVCRRLRRIPDSRGIPVIFLTARIEQEDIVKGFDAGGMDYVAKPFRPAELRARVRTHIELHRLKSFLCTCAKCHKVRNEHGEWERLEQYVARHTPVTFSHGFCPACYVQILGEMQLGEAAADPPGPPNP